MVLISLPHIPPKSEMCGTQGKLKYKCRCVGIGRRPRLKIVWRNPCGFESHHRHHDGTKSALLRRLFMPMAKRRHPPAPLLLLSNCDPLALGSQLVFFFQRFPRRNRSHSVPHFKIVATLLGRDLGRPMRAAIPLLGGLPLTAWAFLMCPIFLEQNGT